MKIIILCLLILSFGVSSCTENKLQNAKSDNTSIIEDAQYKTEYPDTNNYVQDGSDLKNKEKADKIKELEELDKKIEIALNELENTSIDADAYYRNNSEVLDEINVSESDTVFSESEAYTYLNDRGFLNQPITTSYSMGGEYLGDIEISPDSSEKHPIYNMNYISKDGNVWTISLVDSTITAYPVSYNVNTNQPVKVVLTETDYVMSYDSKTNKFFKTIPYTSELIIKKVKKIDANTLNQLTFGGINEL